MAAAASNVVQHAVDDQGGCQDRDSLQPRSRADSGSCFAAMFGASRNMDAFLTAFRAPNMLRDLFAERRALQPLLGPRRFCARA